jgi:predicted nuclease of predicted toxin-antitoxin system
MRILADENIAGAIIEALRDIGHDVAWVLADAPGSSDQDILRRATQEGRVLLTFDTDFGELAFRARLPAGGGVILLKLRATNPASLTSIVLAAIESRDDWAGHFSVIEHDRVRMRSLPG